MDFHGSGNPIDILLVEDNPGDVRLTQEAFKVGKIRNNLYVVRDGVEALDFLFRRKPYEDAPIPDLILLDLNLPKRDGREILEEIKSKDNLRRIPVVVLTTSKADEDVLRSYNLHANCFITKPIDLDEFFRVIRAIENFWLTVVKLPQTQ
jgi:chemotaxis family two-component system response regulator Rcp1